MKILSICFALVSVPALAGIQTGGGYAARGIQTGGGYVAGIQSGGTITTELMESTLFESETAKIFSSNKEIKALQDFQTNDGQRGLIMQDDKGKWRLLLEKQED